MPRKNEVRNLLPRLLTPAATVALLMMIVLVLAAVPAFAQNSVPRTAREAAVQQFAFTPSAPSAGHASSSPTLDCFKPGGNIQVIHDLGAPFGGVTIDRAGNLYGRDDEGNYVYRLAPTDGDWTFTTIYSFLEPIWSSPDDAILGPDAGYYGALSQAGLQNCGSGQYCGLVYRLRPQPTACLDGSCSWLEDVLYQFTGDTDAAGGVVTAFDKAGNLYGYSGAGAQQLGAVFELTPTPSGWSEKVIYNFTGLEDGKWPNSLLMGSDGNLYGTTQQGGPYGLGVFFQLVPAEGGWIENVVYAFQNSSPGGTGGSTRLAEDASGSFYGLAGDLADYGFGIFKLSPSDGQWYYNVLWHTDYGQHYGEIWNMTMDVEGNILATGDSWDRNSNFSFIVEVPHNDYGRYVAYFDQQILGSKGALAVNKSGGNHFLYGAGCGRLGGSVWQLTY